MYIMDKISLSPLKCLAEHAAGYFWLTMAQIMAQLLVTISKMKLLTGECISENRAKGWL